MTNIIGALFLIIFGVIAIALVLAHSWGFWHVYKQPIKNGVSANLILRGAMAGLTGWFWLFFIGVVWSWKSGGGILIVLWFYGLFIVPIIGVIFTIPVWKVLDVLKLDIGVFGRGLLGFTIGIAGIASVHLIDSPATPESEWRRFVLPIIILSSMVPFVAIMAGEKQLMGLDKNYKKQIS